MIRNGILLACICFYVGIKAQPFHPRDFVLSASNGAAFTNYHLTDTAGYDLSDWEAGFNYRLRGEYGLSPWLSVDFNSSVALLITETILRQNARCYIMDIGPGVSYHLPWDYQWIDLEGGIGINYTHYLYDDGDGHERVDASGVSVSADFHPRLYFTKRQRLGGLAYYRYNMYFMSAEYTFFSSVQPDLKMNGDTHSFGLGLFYRFGNRSTEPTPPSEKSFR